MDILFVKTSSLGDVIHSMPAITDARRRLPDARLAWIVEEAFAPLVRLHPAVDEVIPIAARRWRGALHLVSTWREMKANVRAIRAREYDEIIDCQGLLRTAVITKLVRGRRRHGYDARSVRETLASRFYDLHHSVGWDLHAVVRNRLLTGLALGYSPEGPIDFGLDRTALTVNPATNRAILLHGTARAYKEWPCECWIALGQALNERGMEVVLPWGTDAERQRSETIAAQLARARVPERRPLDRIAQLIAGASLVIGVDTGLLHLAAALGVPVIAIFVGTEPDLNGPKGAGTIEVVGGKSAVPPVAAVVDRLDKILDTGSAEFTVRTRQAINSAPGCR